MTSSQSRAALRSLLKVAIPCVEALPQAERAEAYDGVVVACQEIDPEMRDAAAAAAQAIREANSAQMIFAKLLS